MIPIYVNEIRQALENKCYFSALSLALTLPDICGMAAFPDESVGGRYIKWYDKYLGEHQTQSKVDLGGNSPWLSGEVVYNLRNTYLHQGNPGIVREKVKEEANRLDKFTLILGDGTLIHSLAFAMEGGTEKTGKVSYRVLAVDVTYLCNVICDGALNYYNENQEKFKFDFDVITQEELMQPPGEKSQAVEKDWVVEILNHKWKEKGLPWRVMENPDRNIAAEIMEKLAEAQENLAEGREMKQITFPHQHESPSQ